MHRITWETSTVKQPTLSICSPVDSLYVVWNVSFSEMAPFVFFHDTSGLGSPLTLTRKIAVSPERGVHSKWQACINPIHDKQAYIPSMLRLRRPPSSTVTGASLHLKSGVLLPSGMLVTYCVMITPGSLDLFFMMAETNGNMLAFTFNQNGHKQKHKYSSWFWWGGMICFCYQQRSGLSHISCDAH